MYCKLDMIARREYPVRTKLNVARLVDDVGGPAEAARLCDVTRTAPYGWISRRYLSSVVLERLKAARPELELDDYFEELNEIETGGRS